MGGLPSKTTIHKYLREIEVEEGGATQAASDAIFALATQLAKQLKREATAELKKVRARMDDQYAADERARSELKAQLGRARRAVNDVSRRLEAREQDLATVQNQLGAEKIARHTAKQRVLDLASRNQAKKLAQLQAVEARAAALEAQLVDNRTRLAEAGVTAARADIASVELRRQISALEVELSAAKSAIALEERFAKLDKAVFGAEPTSMLNAQSEASGHGSAVGDRRAIRVRIAGRG